jgi:hypothetical protein
LTPGGKIEGAFNAFLKTLCSPPKILCAIAQGAFRALGRRANHGAGLAKEMRKIEEFISRLIVCGIPSLMKT